MNTPSSPQSTHSTAQLDALTGGAFTAPTSGERAARLRQWLATEPPFEQLNEVFKELSHRDRGAAKPLKEKIDEVRRLKSQENIAAEWAAKAQTLVGQSRLNLADAMAWQRDAARAGAPLSREPLSTLKAALAERVKAIEDLQHRVQVQRESAVMLAQRIEILSTKSWQEAQQSAPGLAQDVAQCQALSEGIETEAQWPSVDVKFPPMLQTARNQLQLVWEAFDAALASAVLASVDPQAPLPAVPVWAEALRQVRAPAAGADKPKGEPAISPERKAEAEAALGGALSVLEAELAQGHGKATPKAAADLRAALKAHGRAAGGAWEAKAHTALGQAGELEGWQRWRADQLREALLAQAEGLLTQPEGQRIGGRKMQETLRKLRDQWKTTDQGGQPNHALWKRFDEACTLAHKVVEDWLAQIRQQADVQKAVRQGLLDELKAWTLVHADNTEWKAQLRDLSAFSERWRQAGHLSEKAFADWQPQWKTAMHAARAGLEEAQQASLARRRALIDEAQALGAQETLRLDAVRDLQQRWQAEAQQVPLERKVEQKLWEAFRQPIDQAFERKSSERERAASAVSEVDRMVLQAAKAVEAATQSGDAQAIRQALQALELAAAGKAVPAVPAATAAAPAAPAAPAPADGAAPADAQGQAEPAASDPDSAAVEATGATDATDATDTNTSGAADAAASTETAEPVQAEALVKPAAPAKKLVAVRGDDRPGMQRGQTRDDRREGGRDRRPDGRSGPGAGGPGGRRDDARGPAPGRFGRDSGMGYERPERGPRLGDAAFRAQRQALEAAEHGLRKLAAQAHGEVLSGLMQAWQTRDAAALPSASALGPKLGAAGRTAWAQALTGAAVESKAEVLLRLEMAAELPTPAEHLSQRRMLQLQLLTRRHDAGPAQTWVQDAAAVLASTYDESVVRRFQACLKALLRA